MFLTVNVSDASFSLHRVPSVSDAFVDVKGTIASSHWLFLCIIDGILLRQIELYSFCGCCVPPSGDGTATATAAWRHHFSRLKLMIH